MNTFTQIVFVVGRRKPDYVEMLGTGFLIRENGHIVTTYHVTGPEDSNLVILMPRTNKINEYQDLAETACKTVPVAIQEIDPVKDLTILKAEIQFSGRFPRIGGFDEIGVGDSVGIFGFPHSVEGRRALTFQRAEIGAKVLMDTEGVRSKHAVINTQARPGQSGSLVFSLKDHSICGILIGAWAPVTSGKILLGGINPRELHQTAHCISAEYLQEML